MAPRRAFLRISWRRPIASRSSGIEDRCVRRSGNYGKGFLSWFEQERCRLVCAVMLCIQGGSVGFQIGGRADLVMLIIPTQRGADKLLESKLT